MTPGQHAERILAFDAFVEDYPFDSRCNHCGEEYTAAQVLGLPKDEQGRVCVVCYSVGELETIDMRAEFERQCAAQREED